MSILWKLQCALRIFRISSIFICTFLYFHLKMTNSRMKTSFQTKCIAYGALSHVFNIIAAFCFANNLHLFCFFFSCCNRLSDTTACIYHLLMIIPAWFFFSFHFRMAQRNSHTDWRIAVHLTTFDSSYISV